MFGKMSRSGFEFQTGDILVRIGSPAKYRVVSPCSYYYVIALLKGYLSDTIRKETVEREFIKVGHEDEFDCDEEVDDGC
jgi:hypothetical protein